MEIRISRYSDLWAHTMMRIENAEKKAKSPEHFKKQMFTRLKKITNPEKLHYAIAVLKYKGYDEIADYYDARLVMDELTKEFGEDGLEAL